MDDKKLGCALGGCLLLLLLSACGALVAVGVLLWQHGGNFSWSFSTGSGAGGDMPHAATSETTATPYPTFSPTAAAGGRDVMAETLQALHARVAPINDPVALAHRLKHVQDVWATPAAPPAHRVGDEAEFWVSNVDTNESKKVKARLVYMRPHVYFWIDERVSYDQDEVQRLVDAFEDKIYPTDRAFFGSEWTPGIDGDPHLYILYTYDMGSWVAGYFSSADEVPPFAHPYSNAHEMFMLSAENTNLSSDFTYGVLAHEFQHMIHWYHDRNETTWLNEGASELAAFLNGYDVGGSDWIYARNADIQLNAWADPQTEDTSPHYGASFLFVAYFLGRYGEQATRTLIGRPENGLESVDLTLQELGEKINADDLFAEWAVANWLQDETVGRGNYAYAIDYDVPSFEATEWLSACPGELRSTVHQYGVDYVRLACEEGAYQLQFSGATTVPLFPAAPHSGDFVMWTGYGDESDITLTREFDLSGVSSATLKYWTWYDIEVDYDYAYVEISTDGQQWEILKTPSSTDRNPAGNSYGWGYTGVSGGGETATWVEESVDLSPYAGQKVWVRFEYITDAAVNRVGWLLDDIAIPEIGYAADFEDGLGGWKAEGFVRVGQWLPQTFRLTLLTWQDGQVNVQPLTLDAENRVTVPLQVGGRPAILVVSGTTRVTREEAQYQITVSP